MTAITRRAAFGAIASASSSLALVTAAAAAAPVEGDAVKPTPQQRFDNAVTELKAAAEALDPNIYQWTVNTNDDKQCGIVIAAFRTTTTYEGDGWYESRYEWGEVKRVLVTREPEHDKKGERWFRIRPPGKKFGVLMGEHDFRINYGPKLA
ncbi:MAG: hypothetical protein E5W74_16865 [Mesorhizobium sp.]|uniref:hypothetical protein n=1 Tax=Mesorhizobium sp. TaxID=1871066 RepID=UPI001210BB94|nr:hypothetical protein [Mesorhizobium sp.]TIT10319.1 MAG: hypothetical protein E5W74_16865 [Mesorhizobium sp.]